MARYNRNVFLEAGMDMRAVKSRDPYRVRIFAPKGMPESYRQYAEYFYKAAHQIARYLLETDKSDISELDGFFFALAFLYRHSVEQLLKGICLMRTLLFSVAFYMLQYGGIKNTLILIFSYF